MGRGASAEAGPELRVLSLLMSRSPQPAHHCPSHTLLSCTPFSWRLGHFPVLSHILLISFQRGGERVGVVFHCPFPRGEARRGP